MEVTYRHIVPMNWHVDETIRHLINIDDFKKCPKTIMNVDFTRLLIVNISSNND